MRRHCRSTVLPLALTAMAIVMGAGFPAGAFQSAKIPFTFSTGDFWLNLHHYLYVLGRARVHAPDWTQPAVASAPEDERQGLSSLTAEEQRTWAAAVATYADGLSRNSSMLARPLADLTIGLANTGEIPAFPAVGFDPAARDALERAAPLYRGGWWPRHRAMNEQYVARLRQQIERDGAGISEALARIYQLSWPDRPFPTSVVAYANFQGAFSYPGRLMVLSSNENSLNGRWYPLEIVFHEAMHQWDDDVQPALQVLAARQHVSLAPDLSHALIFFAVGHVVQRIHPDHKPLIDAADLWRARLSGARVPVGRLRPALETIWQPYVDGRGTRDEAFAAMVAAAAAPPP